ncbi:MAG: Magnesium transport protein CorA [Betaproteobacteria bacterium ADurb.Bin341]|nr:MAG: Magnesium transport protein CorA [Betaproteobacteria bacterium ADurb.Bin341]
MKAKVHIHHPRKQRSRKSGLPPGTLVLIGEVKTKNPRLTLIDYGPSGLKELELEGIQELRDYRRQHETLWVNLCGLQDTELLREVSEFFGLHPLAIEDILNTDQRPKLDDYVDILYLDLHLHRADNQGVISTDQISIALGKDFVFTVQELSTGTLEQVRQRLRTDGSALRNHEADFLTYSILDAIVDSHFFVIEQLSERCDLLEDEILNNAQPEIQHRLHQLKREITQLRRNFWPLRELLGNLQHIDSPLVNPKIHPYLRDVQDHVIHLVESLEDLRDLIISLQDIYLSTLSHRVNLELRTLTVLATTFMPAALIAGIFGMNFKTMPWIEKPEGFILAMGLMATIALIMLIAFWRRRMV